MLLLCALQHLLGFIIHLPSPNEHLWGEHAQDLYYYNNDFASWEQNCLHPLFILLGLSCSALS